MNNSFKVGKSLNITNPYSGKIINFNCKSNSNMANINNSSQNADSIAELINDIVDNYFPSISDNNNINDEIDNNKKTSIIKNI